MRETKTEELIIRWMDGEPIDQREMNILKEIHAQDPSMILNPSEFALIRQKLRMLYPIDQDLPNGELFESSLRTRIQKEEELEEEISELKYEVDHLKEITEVKVKPRYFERLGLSRYATHISMGISFLGGILTGCIMNIRIGQNTIQDLPTIHALDTNVRLEILDNKGSFLYIKGLDPISRDTDLFDPPPPPPVAIMVTPIKKY